MLKKISLIFLLILIATFNSGAQEPPVNEKPLLKISFMYYTGDANLMKKEKEFTEWLKEKHPKVVYKAVPFKNEFGDWGPTDYFFELKELNSKQASLFIKEIKSFFNGISSVEIEDNRPSYGNRE